MNTRALRFAIVVLGLASVTFAQPLLRVPQASPHARTDQTVGITEISVDYHRPAVNKRPIWGGLVPYDVIWRAGANEPTLVTVSTPVTVEGQPLAAGTYSFYLVPSQQQWTAVFNRFTGGWGTYSYDQSEDALRVQVTPQTADMQERLLYTFDDVKDDAATMNLRWEKLRVPIRFGADTKNLTLAEMRNRLRSGYHWQSSAFVEAARYALRNGDPDTALAYANRAMELSPDRASMRVKAAVLEKKGDVAGAKALRDRAAALQPDYATLGRAYDLIGQKKYDEALKAANDFIANNPDSFRGYALLGDVQSAMGDKTKAQASYQKALSFAKDQSERVEVQDSINAAASGG